MAQFQNSTTIGVRMEYHVKELAHSLGINVSEICRNAIEKEIGITLQKTNSIEISTKPVLDKYSEFLEWKKEQEAEIVRNITMIHDMQLQQQKLVTETIDNRKDIQHILENSGGVKRYFKYLPEADQHGDFSQASQQLASEISQILKQPVTKEQLYDAIRAGGCKK